MTKKVIESESCPEQPTRVANTGRLPISSTGSVTTLDAVDLGRECTYSDAGAEGLESSWSISSSGKKKNNSKGTHARACLLDCTSRTYHRGAKTEEPHIRAAIDEGSFAKKCSTKAYWLLVSSNWSGAHGNNSEPLIP